MSLISVASASFSSDNRSMRSTMLRSRSAAMPPVLWPISLTVPSLCSGKPPLRIAALLLRSGFVAQPLHVLNPHDEVILECQSCGQTGFQGGQFCHRHVSKPAQDGADHPTLPRSASLNRCTILGTDPRDIPSRAAMTAIVSPSVQSAVTRWTRSTLYPVDFAASAALMDAAATFPYVTNAPSGARPVTDT